MKEAEIKKLIGKENWEDFSKWMRGQTYGRYEDGSINFYECDVMAFKKKLDTGYDRQKDPMVWDQGYAKKERYMEDYFKAITVMFLVTWFVMLVFILTKFSNCLGG